MTIGELEGAQWGGERIGDMDREALLMVIAGLIAERDDAVDRHRATLLAWRRVQDARAGQ